jgi:hypothetical protein
MTVQAIRRALATVRGIERNWRLGRYEGRNSTSTSRFHARLLADYYAAERELPRRVRGLLVAEHDLAKRVSVARDDGQVRPELEARLAETRRALRRV